MRDFTGISRTAAIVLALLAVFASEAAARRLAIIAPDSDAVTRRFLEALTDSPQTKIRFTDTGLAAAAFATVGVANPYNMSREEVRLATSAIGCEFILVVRAETLRRYSATRGDYFEAYASVHLAGGRFGRLVRWRLLSFPGTDEKTSERALIRAVPAFLADLPNDLATAVRTDSETSPIPDVEDVPDEKSPDARGFRPPLPYRRISPLYPATASIYKIAATVDIEVVIDAEGRVASTVIDRWAGYGLDESVTDAVRTMNWRPADRNGRRVAARILLRYNFRRPEPVD